MGMLSLFVRNCLIARNGTQVNLNEKNLLAGHWEYIAEPPIPVSQEPGKKVPTLAISLWGLVSHLCFSLGMASILLPLCGPEESAHSSIQVAQIWLVALTPT